MKTERINQTRKRKEKNQFYIPKDDKINLFKVRSSDNAIIIFLDYFGYPKLHITLYVKDLPEDKKLFDIHITDEKKSKKIYQTHLEINIRKTEEEINKKLFDLNDDFLNLVKEHKKKSVKKRGLLCLSCYSGNSIKFPEKIEDKTKAKKFYSELLGRTLEVNVEELRNCKRCKYPEHNTFIDNKITDMYLRNQLGVFTFKDQKDFSYSLMGLLKKKFKKEFSYVEKIVKEVKQSLKEYNNEN